MARRRIFLMGGAPIVTEDQAALEAITPGHLLSLETNGVGLNDDVANVAILVAMERDEMGDDIDVAYAIGDQVKVANMGPGQRAYCWLASGQNVAKGDYLAPAANGLLSSTGVTSTLRSALALEAKNTATADAQELNAAGDARIRVQFV